MKQYKTCFISAILSKNNFAEKKQIEETLLPLFESVDSSMSNKLSVVLLLASEHPSKSIEENLKHIEKKFKTVISIIEEHAVKLPEEECALEEIVKKISEEGEGSGESAPVSTSDIANTSANIESGTARIHPKKKKDETNT